MGVHLIWLNFFSLNWGNFNIHLFKIVNFKVFSNSLLDSLNLKINLNPEVDVFDQFYTTHTHTRTCRWDPAWFCEILSSWRGSGGSGADGRLAAARRSKCMVCCPACRYPSERTWKWFKWQATGSIRQMEVSFPLSDADEDNWWAGAGSNWSSLRSTEAAKFKQVEMTV